MVVKKKKKKNSCPQTPVPFPPLLYRTNDDEGRSGLFQHLIELDVLDIPTLHGALHIPLEILSRESEILCGFLVQRVGRVWLEEQELQPRKSVLIHPPNTKHARKEEAKHTCNPTITAFKFRTGFQSSRKMFRQTLPSRSMFGW